MHQQACTAYAVCNERSGEQQQSMYHVSVVGKVGICSWRGPCNPNVSSRGRVTRLLRCFLISKPEVVRRKLSRLWGKRRALHCTVTLGTLLGSC